MEFYGIPYVDILLDLAIAAITCIARKFPFDIEVSAVERFESWRIDHGWIYLVPDQDICYVKVSAKAYLLQTV